MSVGNAKIEKLLQHGFNVAGFSLNDIVLVQTDSQCFYIAVENLSAFLACH